MCLCWQVALSEPGTSVSVQGHMAESQAHRRTEAEPDRAAQERQWERAVTRDARDGLVLFERGRKKKFVMFFFTLSKDFVF